jgi:predicted DNA-binding ribbon-helix-helix protein
VTNARLAPAPRPRSGGLTFCDHSRHSVAVTPYHPPVKRSVTIAGHETSISLEPVYWDALRTAAAQTALPLSALIAQIDSERIAAATPPNLASAIRVWLFERAG